MTKPVNYWNAPRGTTMHACADGTWINATDYARLEQECERLSNELNNMRISWGLMQSEREAALKQVERLTAMLHRTSKAESRPEFMQIIAEALSTKS